MKYLYPQNISKKTKHIIISVGDEMGIGPEIILKALASNELPRNLDILIVGSKQNLIKTFNELHSKGITNIANPKELNIANIDHPKPINKNPYVISGNASFFYLRKAIQIVKSLPNAALVTGPICKKSWALAGHDYSGQTELLAELCNTSNVGMLFTAESPFTGWRFSTLLTTTHIPLNAVSQKITEKLLISKLDLLYNFCKKFNQKPLLKVAGLNPHAGEEGLLGNEEQITIKDTLINWNKENPQVTLEGPLSPDSCWISSANAWREKKYPTHDGILAMYHDQGLIPMKIIAANYSVNTTVGLPIIRTSPDHGTGFDIHMQGKAQSKSMIEAIKTANNLLTNSNLFNSH